MRWLTACVVVVGLNACKSEAEKLCFATGKPAADRVSACGEACNNNGDACVEGTKLATDSCMAQQDAEVCRWMCNYGRTGKDLYCAEYKKITGHDVDEIPN